MATPKRSAFPTFSGTQTRKGPQMPLQPILDHNGWKSMKKQCKLENFSVPGVDVGKALEVYKTQARNTYPTYAGRNNAAASTLIGVLKKYADKIAKEKKLPPIFVANVIGLMEKVKSNQKHYQQQIAELDDFVQTARNFTRETKTLENLNGPALLKKLEVMANRWGPIKTLLNKNGQDEIARDANQVFETFKNKTNKSLEFLNDRRNDLLRVGDELEESIANILRN
jgi:hypothetical protein